MGFIEELDREMKQSKPKQPSGCMIISCLFISVLSWVMIYTGNREWSIIAAAIIFTIITLLMYISSLSKKTGGGANLFDQVKILKCTFDSSITLSGFPNFGTFSRMIDGVITPMGTLKMAIGTSPFSKMPQHVDVKMFIINDDKNVLMFEHNFRVQKSGMIGVIESPLAIRPLKEEFIYRAWIVAAYYEDGSIWTNENAPKYERESSDYIKKKCQEILSNYR